MIMRAKFISDSVNNIFETISSSNEIITLSNKIIIKYRKKLQHNAQFYIIIDNKIFPEAVELKEFLSNRIMIWFSPYISGNAKGSISETRHHLTGSSSKLTEKPTSGYELTNWEIYNSIKKENYKFPVFIELNSRDITDKNSISDFRSSMSHEIQHCFDYFRTKGKMINLSDVYNNKNYYRKIYNDASKTFNASEIRKKLVDPSVSKVTSDEKIKDRSKDLQLYYNQHFESYAYFIDFLSNRNNFFYKNNKLKSLRDIYKNFESSEEFLFLSKKTREKCYRRIAQAYYKYKEKYES
jgi:hypothetical protein